MTAAESLKALARSKNNQFDEQMAQILCIAHALI
jgi:hypothetical protein